MPNTSANPFDHAFEMLGHSTDIVTESVHAKALDALAEALTSRAVEKGRMVLLRSPRAGFGKTHLLMRLQQQVAPTHEFIPLDLNKGSQLDGATVLDTVLRRFSRILPAGGGLTMLDLLARKILAIGLESLVRAGEVPSHNRESALQALQSRPVETLDFHNAQAVTAQWVLANFELLGPRLTAELTERAGAGSRPVAWWLALLFRYSATPLDQTTRNIALFETVFGSSDSEAEMHERLVALLNLTGLVTSPLLVLDEVEGFLSHPDAALQVATFLNLLHQSCNKLAVIISVNGDVWESKFLPCLPYGLKDRLCDILIDLQPMTKAQAIEFVKDRAGADAENILENLDLDTGKIYARGLIREASRAWVKLKSGVAQLSEPSEPEEVKTIPVEPEESESEPVSDEAEDLVDAEETPAKPVSPFTSEMEPITQEPMTQEASPFTVAESHFDSPFFIDTEPAPKSEEPLPIAQPFSASQSEDAPQPHSVTTDDHEKVDELLRQFRDRYGRKG